MKFTPEFRVNPPPRSPARSDCAHGDGGGSSGAGHRVVVEGLSSQSVRPLRGLTGEARSRPGVTVAGGPTVQKILRRTLFLVWDRAVLPLVRRITDFAYKMLML